MDLLRNGSEAKPTLGSEKGLEKISKKRMKNRGKMKRRNVPWGERNYARDREQSRMEA